MTRTLRAPGGARRSAALAALALVAAALAALTISTRADAAFTTPQCQGADITGRGASFARDAHSVFKFDFENRFCQNGPAVTYEALGSGAGREVVGARRGANASGVNSRNQVPRFGMTDEPPSVTEVNQINMGTDTVGDEDRIHVIPAAVGSVAPLVNFPNNCDVNLLNATDKTDEQGTADGIPDGTVRVRFTKAKFEAAWAKEGTADNWTELFPELASDADCNVPIIRVVRFDESGTSFSFKDYLDTINPARGWLTTFASGTAGTRNWPGATFGVRDDPADACPAAGTPPAVPSGPGREANTIDTLTSGCSNGNGSLVSKLIGTDGSIGYSDISTARTASPSLAITPRTTAESTFDNDTYWTQIPNGSGCTSRRSCTSPAGSTFTEPTASPNGFRTDGPRGANCQSTTFTNVPASTLGDWSKASGVNAPAGYGICTLTYGLLFDDYAKAYALQGSGEERKARTVKDYWTNIVSAGGQGVLFSQDYAPLSQQILTIAAEGVDAIGFDKAATGGGGNTGPGPGTGTTPPGGGGGGGGTAPPPSNVFSVPRTVLTKKGTAILTVRLPGAGTVVLNATAKVRRKRIKVGGLKLTVTTAGTYKLTLKPGRAARRVLNKKGRLRTSIKLTFTPRGGAARSSTKTVTLKKTLKRKRTRSRR